VAAGSLDPALDKDKGAKVPAPEATGKGDGEIEMFRLLMHRQGFDWQTRMENPRDGSGNLAGWRH
jgi:hypothetical protein